MKMLANIKKNLVRVRDTIKDIADWSIDRFHPEQYTLLKNYYVEYF